MKKLAPLCMLLAALCWSVCGVLVKACRWPGIYITILRGSIIVAVYGFISFYSGRRFKIDKYKILIALGYFGQSSLLMLAFKYTTAGSATALQNTSLLGIMALNYLILKQKPQKKELITCAFLLFGVFIILGGTVKSGGRIIGNLLALASALFYACLFFFSGISEANTIDALVLGNCLLYTSPSPRDS